MKLTDLIKQLGELEKKATLGPWKEERWNDDGNIVEVNDSTGWKKSYPAAYIARLGGWGYGMTGNGGLIVSFRNSLPRLLEAYKKMQEALMKIESNDPESFEASIARRCIKDIDGE